MFTSKADQGRKDRYRCILKSVDVKHLQKDILKILKTEKNGLALREIQEKLPELSDRQIRKELARLQALGMAYSYGHGRGAGWKSH